MSRLTIELDAALLDQARHLAAARQITVSALIADLLRERVPQANAAATTSPPDLAALTGARHDAGASLASQARGLAKLPPGKSADDVLYEALCEKYDIKPS